MKMRNFWCLLFVVSLPAESFGAEKKAKEVIGTLGKSVTFHLETSQQFSLVSWLQVKRNIVNIAILETGQSCSVRVLHSKFEERLNASRDCRGLQITDLQQDDSGNYRAQIKDYTEDFSLKIYKNLLESDLEVQCETNTLGDGSDTVLNCSAGKWGDGVHYSWTSTSKGRNISSHVIHSRFQDGDTNYTCTAENPVSKASRTISVKELCEGNTGVFMSNPLSYVLMGVTIAALIVVKVIVNVFVSVRCFSGTKQRDTPRRRGESVALGRSRR
ncbi:SLAM family member 5-like [Heteronotia binoei]|uniref:SLAM family member 5-like n=1 Tax=Heteronotia binoei TaxID=13085 RepID=UPI00292CA8F5|nr:SLAM family member 5-like [Heteronotia binoei]